MNISRTEPTRIELNAIDLLGSSGMDKRGMTHAMDAAYVLEQAGCNDLELLAATILHDVLEDTAVTSAEIEACTSRRVAMLVESVTGVGPNRKARNAHIYAKLDGYPDGVFVKLADRISNWSDCLATGDSRLGMYVKEYPEFRNKLEPLVVDTTLVLLNLWIQLDDLYSRSKR